MLRRIHSMDVEHELERTALALLAADNVAETAMQRFTWERRGWLGRLVRTPAPTAGVHDGVAGSRRTPRPRSRLLPAISSSAARSEPRVGVW